MVCAPSPRSGVERVRRAARIVSLAVAAACAAGVLAAASLPARAAEPLVPLPAPLLTLDDAVAAALDANRPLRAAQLAVTREEERIAALKTRRLPQTEIYALGWDSLDPLTLEFPRGAFGSFPPIGPFPPEAVTLETDPGFQISALAYVAQPLTQQVRIGLGLRLADLERQVRLEDARARRSELVSRVKQAYYGLARAQAGVETSDRALSFLRELQRVVGAYRAEETVLRADELEVAARLAQVDAQRLGYGFTADRLREQLNLLMGRPLATPFRIVEVPQPTEVEGDMAAARERARARRPELATARLKREQADVDRRLAGAEWIPDVSLMVGYARIGDLDYLPDGAWVAGVLLTWEPWDWGRRRHETRAREITAEQAALLLQEAEEQVDIDVGARWRRLAEARAALAAARATQAAMEERLRVAANRFREDAALVKDTLEAEAKRAEADAAALSALAEFWNARAELDAAIGDE